MTIGEKIQELMDWAGLQQKELAELADISASLISDYIRDVREPTLEALRKLAQALKVSPWVLISGDPLPVTPLDVTEAEGRRLAQYRSLMDSERYAVDVMLDTLCERRHRD